MNEFFQNVLIIGNEIYKVIVSIPVDYCLLYLLYEFYCIFSIYNLENLETSRSTRY